MAEYDSIDDPYCYRGSQVLRNRLGIRDADALSAFEMEIADQRAREPLPAGRLTISHFRNVHRHLFGDVYGWAGRFRTVRISKGSSMFCYPENIGAQLATLFASPRHDFWGRMRDEEEFVADLAHFLAELNAIHAFREGNGRTQIAFAQLIAARQGYWLHLERLDPRLFLSAMVASFNGDEAPLAARIRNLLG